MRYSNSDLLSSTKQPDTIFHYTTPSGLIGILQLKKIWATDIRFLNDKKEFQYTIDITKSIIDEHYKTNSNKKYKIGFNYDFLEFIRINFGDFWNPIRYIASFSEVGDQLSQWRAYCPKGGYSLGFNFKEISEIAKTFSYRLAPCIYDYQTQREILTNIFESNNKTYEDSLKKFGSDGSDARANNISIECMLQIFQVATIFKHESFEEEKEWRLVVDSARTTLYDFPIRYRSNDSTIIPYIELPLSQNEQEIIFNKVIVGPSSSNRFALDILSNLLENNVEDEESIVYSKSPYRHQI